MNRKLNNSLSALAITGAVLVTTVVFGLNPLVVEPSTQPVVAAVDDSTPPPDTDDAAGAPVSRTIDGAAQFRQTLLMPYFSFVPRG